MALLSTSFQDPVQELNVNLELYKLEENVLIKNLDKFVDNEAVLCALFLSDVFSFYLIIVVIFALFTVHNSETYPLNYSDPAIWLSTV